MPSYLVNGLDIFYALWNCGAMRVMLPRRGIHLWVSPTVGGHLEIQHSLHVSGWWGAEQWQRGYIHARELDAQGYWNALPRRKGHSDTGTDARDCSLTSVESAFQM